MMEDVIASSGPKGLMGDQAAYDEALEALCSMFDREIFESIFSKGEVSGALAKDLGGKLSKRTVSDISLVQEGDRMIVISDCLGTGFDIKALIEDIESHGAEVIRMAFIAERTSDGARKNRVLRGYPFESLSEC